MTRASVLIIDDHTKSQQQIASNPAHSAWVSANAGSGKTFVLSRRVVRLLLNGTEPARILCLTFTKAAAGEMSNRVFETLGRWAVLPDQKLFEELKEVEGKAPSPTKMATARTLFARALETPGGLKIQTIHAFCEALLHQFPLEANVPGHFSVIDDAMRRHLIEDAQRSVLLEADADPQAPMGKAYARVMDSATDHAIEKVMKEIVASHEELGQWLTESGGPKAVEDAAKIRFRFSPDTTLQQLQTETINASVFSRRDLKTLAELCEESDKKTDKALAMRIRDFLQGEGAEKQIKALCEIFLSSGKTRSIKSFATNLVKNQIPNLEEKLDKEGARLVKACLRINTFKSIERTTPLLEIAQAIITRYRDAKRRKGLLDFDDLVARSADLLTRKSARQWVLYKLDLGIDHILLDEAQDTSPRQWQILDALVEEFFSGSSARTVNRSVFAVGDEKQSIYSFQGAEPEQFALQRKAYSKLAENVQKPLQNVKLGLSFRSTQDVLSAVDTVFGLPEHAQGITFDEPPPPHTAARHNQPGSVEVWPLELAQASEAPSAWEVPQDQSGISHQAVRLAEKIASQIATWLGKEKLQARGREIAAGDILVLVRARDRFMLALNRALKERGVPVAGTDRLSLTDHIAVQDLMALGQVMLTPEDDLSLASVLKSPLIGLTEEELYILSRSRLHTSYETSLFEALGVLREDTRFADAYSRLSLWRSRVDQLPVYEFFALLLGKDGGRKAFYARLGQESEDVLDAFLGQTLGREQLGLPGLQAFLSDLEADAPEIKREMDKSAGEVRIMTVHAAKGLEAPVVFLVDKCSAAFQSSHAPALYQWGKDEPNSGYLWVPTVSDLGGATLPLREEIQRKSEEEYRRLLYVGMTRAEDRLIVCGYGPKPNKKGTVSLPIPNWHTMVSKALESSWVDIHDDHGELIYHRWQENPQRDINIVSDEKQIKKHKGKMNGLPKWVHLQLPQENALPRPLNPSGAQALIDETLLENKSIPSLLDGQQPENAGDPRLRGNVVHRLLQVLPDLPDAERRKTGRYYLHHKMPGVDEGTYDSILDSVVNTIASPELASYFNPATSRPEVPLMGRIDLKSGLRSVAGIIDRLAVLDNRVMLLDYKTSPNVPQSVQEVPPDYITQMALYQRLVSQIYPDKEISATLVWTSAKKGPHIMALPSAILNAAYKKIAQL